MSETESIEDIINDFLKERLISTIYRCYEEKTPKEQIYIKCIDAIWNSNNPLIRRRIRMLENSGCTLDDLFPIKIIPLTHKLIKQPMEILSLADLQYKFENFEDITEVDKKRDEIRKLERKISRTIKQYKLWKTGEVFEGFHDGFTLEEELEFYKNKMNKLIPL
ncbi:hypothetical protein ES705_21123 [subsurface metagenome]